MRSSEDIRKSLISSIASIDSQKFNQVAMDVFRFQARQCRVYADYLQSLNIIIKDVTNIHDIPYLPISAFKNYEVKTGKWDGESIFTSSSTTGSIPSKHHIRDMDWYNAITACCFENIYGSLGNYSFFCLLPNYLERQGSSLVHMANNFIMRSGNAGGFYLYDYEQMIIDIQTCTGKKVLLGVSYALLDLATMHPFESEDLIVMETGGMKGRKAEMNRSELHTIIKTSFGVSRVHSEYGMTELLSQAYSTGDGIFIPSKTLKVTTAQINDPLCAEDYGRSGLLRMIDLANIDSCSFILTDDLGISHPDGSFQVLGRTDHSEIRGCNLMVSDL